MRGVGGLVLSDFKTYYTDAVIKIGLYCQNNRQIERWNRIESPEMHPHKYSRLIFDKETEMQWSKDSVSKWG